MSFTSALRISASALTAQRLRLDVIAGNLANVNTTRSADGGPYRRREVVFGELLAPRSLVSLGSRSDALRGVRVLEIAEHEAVRLVHDPKHPDADATGHVAYPDVDLVEEMAGMMSAVRAYEASVAAMNAAKSMAMKALEISRG